VSSLNIEYSKVSLELLRPKLFDLLC